MSLRQCMEVRSCRHARFVQFSRDYHSAGSDTVRISIPYTKLQHANARIFLDEGRNLDTITRLTPTSRSSNSCPGGD